MADTAPEFSPRQISALTGVSLGTSESPATAKTVAEAIEPGSDARGAAQTLRRLAPDYVVRQEDGSYKLTRKGANVVKKHSTSPSE